MPSCQVPYTYCDCPTCRLQGVCQATPCKPTTHTSMQGSMPVLCILEGLRCNLRQSDVTGGMSVLQWTCSTRLLRISSM